MSAIDHAPPAIQNLSRRHLLQGFGAGALVLAIGAGDLARAADKKFGADSMPGGSVDDPLAFVILAADGGVTIICHRS
jgi:isoquinoline 1-oxidoreductase beta subunit